MITAQRRYSHSSIDVRRSFLNYFESADHEILPSASILPRKDKSIPFTNAGMNAFRGVFTGVDPPPAPRVANIQKCIRVSGKHNDLEDVGSDGTHHTFFEMMGNWSFNAYGREEACQRAWRLLTDVYAISPDRLFVTYFQGCPQLGVAPDLRTREVWLSLGVNPDRILPFGARDNFWEMGATGPCGPCTEIHYDHHGRGAHGVNQGWDDLVEIWNIVLINHLRTSSDQIEPLKDSSFIDTGMGLERLVAVLNGRTSNYDTDLFQPIFGAIADVTGATPYSGTFGSKAELDTAYRIIADHIRMLVVCVADGVYPDSNHRVRNVMRRMFRATIRHFQGDQVALLVAAQVACEILGQAYPEIGHITSKAELILDFEREHYQHTLDHAENLAPKLIQRCPKAKNLEIFDVPQIYDSVEYFRRHHRNAEIIDETMAKYCIQSFGLDDRLLNLVSLVTGIPLKPDLKFSEVLRDIHSKTKEVRVMWPSKNQCEALIPTDDQHKYTYQCKGNAYSFPVLISQVQSVFSSSGTPVPTLSDGDEGMILLDQTCLYPTAGGQACDHGILKLDRKGRFEISDVNYIPDSPRHIAHFGKMVGGSITSQEKGRLTLDAMRRIRLMQNHTGTHLLNSVLNKILPLTCQKSSVIEEAQFKYDFSIFNAPFDLNTIIDIEKTINELIEENLPIERLTLSKSEYDELENVVEIPGEHYPDPVHIVRLPNGHTEPCCGTHLVKTGDIQAFAIVDSVSPSYGVRSFKCVTGENAVNVREAGIRTIERVFGVKEASEKIDATAGESVLGGVVRKLKKEKENLQGNASIPYSVRVELLSVIESSLNRILPFYKKNAKEKVLMEFEDVLANSSHLPYFVHLFQEHSDTTVNLNAMVKKIKGKPVLLVVQNNNFLSFKASIPEELVSETFTAKKWLDVVVEPLGLVAKAPQLKKEETFCGAKAPVANIDLSVVEDRLQLALSMAQNVTT